MIQRERRIENPVTGQVMLIRTTGADTEGAVFQAEGVFRPGGFAGPPHVHPRQEERFEVTYGLAGFQIGRQRLQLGPGESLVVPAGQAHTFWNAGPGELRVIFEFRPDLPSTARFYAWYFGMARAGKAGKNGLPSIWQIALQAEEFADHVHLANPPWWLQRAVFAILRPIAHLRGYRPMAVPA